jgi:hypothetical protein
MRDRAARYSFKKSEKTTPGRAVLVAYVARTPKGKIRLKRIAIRMLGQKEQLVSELPPTDPRYVFENDYKVRKAAHDETRHSARFGAFYDSSARVIYDEC